jgi:hypothetical protein
VAAVAGAAQERKEERNAHLLDVAAVRAVQHLQVILRNYDPGLQGALKHKKGRGTGVMRWYFLVNRI